MARGEETPGVSIGNVGGGIHGSIIAGRDVGRAVITVGGQPVQADKPPQLDELRRLLAELRQELAALAAQKDALKQVSAASPHAARGAEESVREATEKVEAGISKGEASAVHKGLTEATGLLGGILDGAKALAEKAGGLGAATQTMVERLGPIVEKVGVAALWVAKLWL